MPGTISIEQLNREVRHENTDTGCITLDDHANLTLKERGIEQYVQGVVEEINNNWSGKEVLVVSHNPLVQLIGKALNTPELPAIDEATGFDHFFPITRSNDPSEQAKLSHTRYGALPQK